MNGDSGSRATYDITNFTIREMSESGKTNLKLFFLIETSFGELHPEI
jgi:hypothetical protein